MTESFRAYEILNPEGRFPGLIVVDHAGTSTPESFGALGLAQQWRDTHHFCDLGVVPLARDLARRLDVPVILSTASRLVIDLNRWIEDPRSILPQIEGVPIPGNVALGEAARQARHDRIFWPYHRALATLWAQVRQRHADPLFFALHSCTRWFNGARRPWDAGTIWNESPALAHPLLDLLGRDSGLTLGDNKPYSGQGGVYTLDRHCWGVQPRACGFEVSNDLLTSPEDSAAWADRLAGALGQLGQPRQFGRTSGPAAAARKRSSAIPRADRDSARHSRKDTAT